MNQEDKKIKDLTVSDLKNAYMKYLLWVGIPIIVIVIIVVIVILSTMPEI